VRQAAARAASRPARPDRRTSLPTNPSARLALTAHARAPPRAPPPPPTAAGRWTTDEHNNFVLGLKLHGRDWRKINRMVRVPGAAGCDAGPQRRPAAGAGGAGAPAPPCFPWHHWVPLPMHARAAR
jgi:hypothetical protein